MWHSYWDVTHATHQKNEEKKVLLFQSLLTNFMEFVQAKNLILYSTRISKFGWAFQNAHRFSFGVTDPLGTSPCLSLLSLIIRKIADVQVFLKFWSGGIMISSVSPTGMSSLRPIQDIQQNFVSKVKQNTCMHLCTCIYTNLCFIQKAWRWVQQ